MRRYHLLGHAIVTAILLAAVATLAISLLVSPPAPRNTTRSQNLPVKPAVLVADR